MLGYMPVSTSLAIMYPGIVSGAGSFHVFMNLLTGCYMLYRATECWPLERVVLTRPRVPDLLQGGGSTFCRRSE